MKNLSIPVFAVCFATIASADPVISMPAPMSPHAKSWVDDVLPPGALRPAAIGRHNCLGSYPEDAKAAHIEGITSLNFRIAEDGSVKAVTVRKSSCNKALDQAAVACVKVWQYKPAMVQDKPVEVAWRNDVKWVSEPPLVNTITILNRGEKPRPAPPPPPPEPKSAGAPHTCKHLYPPDAVAERAEGIAMVEFTITPEGRTEGVTLSHSSDYASLDSASVACASQWLYQPIEKDGRPVAVRWKTPVRWFIR